MKRTFFCWGTLLTVLIFVTANLSAQITIPGIGQLIAKVIQAIDLRIQRIQTQTIGLQEAQKELENTMSALRLGEIRDWVQDQKDLYDEYFQELWKVKTILSDYHKVAEIVQRQKDILSEYQQAMALFRQDAHFSATELTQMEAVYNGIISESGKNLDALVTIINSFTVQMSDQRRMEIIDGAARGMDKSWRDTQTYSNENAMLSLQRSSDENEYEFLKKIYGL
jgi:hypothetical protein